nr:trafficking kinesin binding protein 1 [Hymenolepis microstoma]
MENCLDDPDALRLILNDKQSDLQMAAQIGKSLLDRNRELDRRLKESENQFVAAMETISQLQHTLGVKEELLQMWNDQTAYDEELPSDDTSFGIMDEPRKSHRKSEVSTKGSVQASQDDIELIHRKLRTLEDENASIRNTRQDEQQTAAMKECLRKLGDAVVYMKNLSEEQYRRYDALIQQQNQVNALAARSRELENSLNQVGLTNEMLASKVEELNTVNQNLVRELREMKDKYDESLTLYSQTQATIRKLRERSRRANFRPTVLYSPLSSKSQSHLFSPLTEKPLANLADELAHSSSNEEPVQSTSHSLDKPLKPSRADNESGEWDDPTLDSSGFVSSSEPFDQSHHTPQPSTNTAVMFDSRRMALQHGIDLDLDVPDMDDVLEIEEELDYVDEYPELIQAFDNQHISLQPTLTNRVLRPSKLPATELQLERPEKRQPKPLVTSSSSRDSSVNRRSWVIDQNSAFKNPSPPTFDDTACTPMGSDPLFPLPGNRPQRLQLVKQLQGSGMLQRWQRLATPSFTAALYERPLSGVASRAGVLPSDVIDSDSGIPAFSSTSQEWSSGFDLNQVPQSGEDSKFVPISSHSLVKNTNKMLNEYLSQRSSLVMPAVIRPQPRSAHERQVYSPTSFRAISPSCRGLLDASELASEPPIPFGSVVMKVPPPSQRPISPQGSGRSSSQHVSSVFRRQNVSRASPTLESLREESNTSSTRPKSTIV